MINLDLGGNGDTHAVTDDVVNEAIHTLDNPLQKDLVLKCLEIDPLKRPTARQLIFHPALFSVPSLKLLSIHMLADEIRNDTHLLFL
jgi:nuclear receptor-binding protein